MIRNRDDPGGGPLRICFVISYRRHGGAERASSELASVLAEMGHEVHFVVRGASDSDYPIDGRTRIHEVTPERNIRSGGVSPRAFMDMLLAAREISRIRPDVVVPFLPWAEFAVAASRISEPIVVATVRNNPTVHPGSRLLRFCKDRFCGRADLIYVQDEAQAGHFRGLLRDKVFILPNLVAPVFFGIATRSGPVRRFAAAGRLEAQKNQAMMIRAFARAAAILPDADLRLDIYGEGRLRGDLERLVRELGMEGRVALPGFSPDIAAGYASADAFLLSSDFEGQPNALMEAMAAGLPCISTDCPTGPSGLIRDGIDGVLVPCGDASAMAEAIAAFVTDPAGARKMGRSARGRVAGICDRERVGAEFIGRCRQAAESRRRRGSVPVVLRRRVR